MLTINHAIVHKLHKEQHGKASVTERRQVLTVNDPVKRLILAIHELYAGKASKGYGRFEADEINFPSAAILRDCFTDGNINFLDASRRLMSVLSTKASAAPLATGGFVLMAQITSSASVSWFVVAIIKNINGSAIDDESLEVTDSMHVDLENLRVAGRVNLTDWESQKEDIRYVGFLKQRGEVAEYFKYFLGCNELIANTEETKKLVKALMKFAKDQGLDLQAEQDFLDLAFNHCNERNKNEEPLSLDALSNAVWPNEPQKLQDAFVSGDIQISDGFVPDGRSIKSLKRMKYKTPYWTIDLDRHALTEGYAEYNQNKGTLTLFKLPDALKNELSSETGNDG